VSPPATVDARRGWKMIGRRFAALFAGEGVARAVGFVLVLVLARRLGPDGFGVVTLGLTLVAWFTFVVDSGTELLNVRAIARAPARFRQIAADVLGLRLALSLVAAVVFVVGVEVFARSVYTRDAVVLFALLLPAIALNLRWMVLGVGGSRGVAVGNVASRVLVLSGALVLVLDPGDVQRVPVLETAGELLYAVVILVYVSRRVGLVRPGFDLGAWRVTLRQSLPLMASGVARATIFSFDVIVVSLALGPRELGIYGVAAKPIIFAGGAITLFSLSFLSAFSATAKEHEAALHERSLRVSFVAGCLAAVALGVASLLVPFVFGHEYSAAVPVLAVMAWRIPFAALAGMYTTVLVARDRQLALMWNAIVLVPVAVVVDLVAILAFGLIGAAVASIVVAALFFAVNYWSVARAEPALSGAGTRPRASSTSV
jgi:O-antigen/teichoic acid export membrane protein